MIEVESRVAQKKIDRLTKELKYLSTDTFLRSLGLKSKANETLSYLLSVFPSSSKGSGSNSSTNEFGMPLEKGFFAESFVSGSKLGFFLGNRLADNSRAQTVLQSLDTGSRAHQVYYDDPIHFLTAAAKPGKGKATMLWVTLSGKVDYSARKGADYIERTKHFLEEHILPQIKADFAAKVESRKQRINRI